MIGQLVAVVLGVALVLVLVRDALRADPRGRARGLRASGPLLPAWCRGVIAERFARVRMSTSRPRLRCGGGPSR